MYCAQSTVYHVGGGTLNTENPFKTYLNFRNNLLLLKKNLPFWRACWVIGIRFFMDLLALIRFMMEGKRKDAWAVSRAHQAFVLSLFGVRVASYGVRVKGRTHNAQRTTHNPQQNKKGTFQGSIVWQFFVKKKRKFTDLSQRDLV